jgi:hypothetical protein
MRLVSTPVCAASRRTFVNNAGHERDEIRMFGGFLGFSDVLDAIMSN